MTMRMKDIMRTMMEKIDRRIRMKMSRLKVESLRITRMMRIDDAGVYDK